MQKPDDAYAVETTPTSTTEGTITITAKKPSNENRIIVTVSDGSQTLTAEIAVTFRVFDGKTVVVVAIRSLGEAMLLYIAPYFAAAALLPSILLMEKLCTVCTMRWRIIRISLYIFGKRICR